MGLFDFVDFDAKDVQAVHAGTAPRGIMLAVLTSQTCGDACWHAREEICRCSCGGKNHGCLNHGGAQPERTSRIDGFMYRLKSIGQYGDVCRESCEINRLAGYKSAERPTVVIGATGGNYTPEQIAQAKAAGHEVWFQQYCYTWQTTDGGAPARVKTASKNQMNWPELAGWKAERGVYLLWERIDKPAPCTVLIVDKATGLPLADQLPKHCH